MYVHINKLKKYIVFINIFLYRSWVFSDFTFIEQIFSRTSYPGITTDFFETNKIFSDLSLQ